MAVMYRYLKYEFNTEDDLQYQLKHSLAEGVHNVGELGIITVVNSVVKIDKVIYENSKPTGIDGCITEAQLEIHNSKCEHG